MLEIPDTLHNIIALLVAGAVFGLGFTVVQWGFGLLALSGKVVVLVLLVLLAVLLVLGRA